MPLMKSKSKQAFEHNLKAEEKAGKPMKQSLAIAYAVKRKAPKKMADGGPVSAKSEKRPMPEQKANDSEEVAHNEGKKPLMQAGWTDRPDKVSRTGMRTTPIKHPKMVPSNVLSRRLEGEEDDLQRSAKVNNGPQEEPPKHDDEMRPDRQGPKVHPMKMMAKGGMINEHVSIESADEDEVEHPAGLESDNDEMSPSHEEFMAGEMEPQYASGGSVESGSKDMNYADGGEIEPMDEEEIEHHASIASAIMARRDKMMAEGGEVDLDENAMEQPNSYYPRNEDAALKENYDEDIHSAHQPEDSNEHGDVLEDEDSHNHDMISRIMAKMKSKSPMVK